MGRENMKIAVFIHGTTIMHKSALGQPRAVRVKQVLEHDESIHDYANYVPVGSVVEKLRKWHEQGAEIVYISSHKTDGDVEKDKLVLKRYNFPVGEVLFQREGEEYKDIAEKIMPDILIEDDCESIGGEKEMTITFVRPEIKQRIKSIIVKEFEGIDRLPDDIESLRGR